MSLTADARLIDEIAGAAVEMVGQRFLSGSEAAAVGIPRVVNFVTAGPKGTIVFADGRAALITVEVRRAGEVSRG